MSNISNHIARIADSLKGREISGDCAYPLVMGVLNVSADSFSDGGKYLSDESALEQAEKMLSEGAAIVDIGAESTRPNAKPLSREEELRLLIPKIRAVRAAFPKVPISVDTYKPEVAAEALVNGADIINDVLVGMENGRCPMGKVAADFKCPVIVMHNSRGEKIGGDFFADLKNGIEKRISAVEREGVSRDRIIIDPGFCFGKSVSQNFEIIARLAELRLSTAPCFWEFRANRRLRQSPAAIRKSAIPRRPRFPPFQHLQNRPIFYGCTMLQKMSPR